MQLPNKAKAYVPPGKLMGYLLSEAHAVGKSKAKFFRSLGFDEAAVTQLEEELLAVARTEEVEDFIPSPHGVKYIVDGSVKTPKGGVARLRTIWIIETGQENPRFVTAYPIEQKQE
jgi:hypothetical protein